MLLKTVVEFSDGSVLYWEQSDLKATLSSGVAWALHGRGAHYSDSCLTGKAASSPRPAQQRAAQLPRALCRLQPGSWKGRRGAVSSRCS